MKLSTVVGIQQERLARLPRVGRMGRRLFSAILAVCVSLAVGCDNSYHPATKTTNLENYFISVQGSLLFNVVFNSNPTTLQIDRTAGTVSIAPDLYSASIGEGPFKDANGYLALTLDTFNTTTSPPQLKATGQLGSSAMLIPDVMGVAYFSNPNQANGYGDTTGQVVPFVGTSACPSLPKAQTYVYLNTLFDPSVGSPVGAYGTVDISTELANVNFVNNLQYLDPSTPVVANAPPPALSGQCGSGPYGNVTAVVQYTQTTSGGPLSPVTFSIVLNSGFILSQNPNNLSPPAIGLAQPASAIDAGSYASAKFLGYVSSPNTFSSSAAFGLSGSSAACSALAASLPKTISANVLYGGEFVNNDPTSSSNCDVALDLGTQDANHPGLFPAATEYLAAGSAMNPGATPIGNPTVVLAGEVSGQKVVFANSGLYLIEAK